MCCLFGIVNYGGQVGHRGMNRILTVLSAHCEVRGTDATGIAYHSGGQLRIYKRPLPAHRMRFALPLDARVIMGHTRMTTQGSEERNYNNHPFEGRCGNTRFALAHNGVLYNDKSLRRELRIHVPKIETDSYIAVQLLEQQKALDFASLKYMAEQVEGSFAFSVLDGRNNLYLVKGDNPLCLYHFPKCGAYVYASTEEILKKAIRQMRVFREVPVKIDIGMGDILRIDSHGRMTTGSFNAELLYAAHRYGIYSGWRRPYQSSLFDEPDAAYVDELKSIAGCFGYGPEDIDKLLREGFSCEEIEEAFYSMEQ